MEYVLVMWDECRVGGRAWDELRRSVMCASRLSEMALRAIGVSSWICLVRRIDFDEFT